MHFYTFINSHSQVSNPGPEGPLVLLISAFALLAAKTETRHGLFLILFAGIK